MSDAAPLLVLQAGHVIDAAAADDQRPEDRPVGEPAADENAANETAVENNAEYDVNAATNDATSSAVANSCWRRHSAASCAPTSTC